MTKKQSGIKFFEIGEEWRKAWISGNSVKDIAKESGQNPQTISRAIWLARIPRDIQTKIKTYPDIFTRKILIDTFAAKRRQCEKEGFKKLILEVERLIEQGAGTKPNLKRTNKQIMNKKKVHLLEKNINPIYNLNEALNAEQKLKKRLKVHCRVSFHEMGNGEIRIFFESKDQLENILMELSNPR
ncbi:hypothetical protein [Silvanigrella aquatica]|uniref:ParB C-terminal dimerisation domain-containing protein n=1 Tax=Silvanigrella aquatica TaxID=1915309 RepID=A0A1L4CX21_9BACT|nr:hypothetical protein [Silvanigrella aquatica]APJ02489.1 hypothetical protein AXG55_00480 [Silvanigrella aquatica]